MCLSDLLAARSYQQEMCGAARGGESVATYGNNNTAIILSIMMHVIFFNKETLVWNVIDKCS